MIPSQGSRLDPGEYTNSVPILIDETNDFDLWGFPGDGTLTNPFLISSYNITASIGIASIRVENVDVYFRIGDCFIRQGSSEYAIQLINTSHAIIEYTTVDSAGGGI
ncbi:MAG: hypothetical protein P1Q69_08160 [Candidatus Thorarchaeota archaeon]|nr:hypothetical protein [Candidatus Thorarchaeota archaeon]